MRNSNIVVAVDAEDFQSLKKLVKDLSQYASIFRVGARHILEFGREKIFDLIRSCDSKIFLDIKTKEIPDEMAKIIKCASRLKVDIMTVHASAGIDGLKAAADNKGDMKVFGVTVLTSFDDNDCHDNYNSPVNARALRFMRNCKLAGIDGVVCSPYELEFFEKHKELLGLLKATPGIRPKGSAINGQKRFKTPYDAIQDGADYLVIGRPILFPPKEIDSPVVALKRIIQEISAQPM